MLGDAGIEDDGVGFGAEHRSLGYGNIAGVRIELSGGVEEAFGELPDGEQITGEAFEAFLDGLGHGPACE